MIVSGENRRNRPFFFAGAYGDRVEFAAMAEGSGDLQDRELDKFKAHVKAGDIEQLDAESKPERAKQPKEDKRQEEDDIDTLRAEYKSLSGEDADKRWGEARLKTEIDTLLKD